MSFGLLLDSVTYVMVMTFKTLVMVSFATCFFLSVSVCVCHYISCFHFCFVVTSFNFQLVAARVVDLIVKTKTFFKI